MLSDVHGNVAALQAVLEDVERASPNLIVFGGDVTWGPNPRDTIERLRELPAPAVFVRGNAERALLEPSNEPTERERWMLDRHTPDDLDFLRSFVEQAVVEIDGLGRVRFCHGSPRSDEECVTPETPEERVSEFMAGVEERVIVTAHTHLQFDRQIAGIRSINPGSVGMPYQGRPGAFWALLGPYVDLRETEYPVEFAVARYRTSGDPLTEEMIETLLDPPAPVEVIEYAEARRFAG